MTPKTEIDGKVVFHALQDIQRIMKEIIAEIMPKENLDSEDMVIFTKIPQMVMEYAKVLLKFSVIYEVTRKGETVLPEQILRFSNRIIDASDEMHYIGQALERILLLMNRSELLIMKQT